MNDPQFSYDVPPGKDLPRKKHGCFFYGCITVIVLALILVMLLYVGYRYANSKLEEWTSPTPEAFPQVQMSPEDREALHKRWAAFVEALESRTPVEPLVLNSDQINALIEDTPELKGRLHVEIKGDKIDGQVSIPVLGRFLNGEAELKASLKEGEFIVTAQSIKVKGKPVSEIYMQSLRTQNLAKDMHNDPKNAELLRKIESIEVKDSAITIKARPKTEEPDETKKDEAKKAEGENPTPGTVEPAPAKAEGKAEPPPPTTPDQVKADSPAAPKSPD